MGMINRKQRRRRPRENGTMVSYNKLTGTLINITVDYFERMYC